jgi:hypothetical protein
MRAPSTCILALLMGLNLTAQGSKKKEVAPATPAPVAAPTPDDITVIKIVPYQPAMRRDPFDTPTDDNKNDKTDLVDDISVKGVIQKDGKYFAVVTDSRGNNTWLPVGHTFRDGSIAAIDGKSVTFHQWEVNSTNRNVYRTVVKTFKREEGKR